MIERNLKIDQLKCLCAFLVIYVHCSPTGIVGENVSALARTAVPIFFIITGYFYKVSDQKEKKKRQIKQVFVLCMISNLGYLIWNIILQLLWGNSIKKYLLEILQPKVLIKFLFFNESPVGVHLWYLGALLYGLIILYFFNNEIYKKVFFMSIPILILVDLVFGKYSLVIFERQFPVFLVRNFLFVAIPYLGIGMFLQEKKDFFSKYLTSKGYIGGIIACSLFVLFERYLLYLNECNALREQYLGTTFLAVFLFLWFATNTNKNISMVGIKCSQVGRRYAAGIYILHPVIITIIEQTAKKWGIYTTPVLLKSIFVFVMTVTVVYFVQEKVLIKFRGKYK